MRSLGFCFATSHRIDALLSISSRPWPMPWAPTRPSQSLSSLSTQLVMRESRPGGRSGRTLEDHHQHLMDLFSSSTFVAMVLELLRRYESRSYNNPSATPRLIVADSLGISSGRGLQHWQALAAALEANKTIINVGLSADAINQLTDEGKQASLLGMKEWKEMKGPLSLDCLPRVRVGYGGVSTSQTRWWGLEPHPSHLPGKSSPGNPGEKKFPHGSLEVAACTP